MSNLCVDCGTVAMGIRCRRCYGRFEQEEFARALADSDRELLAMRDGEGLSAQRISDRLGVSRSRVYGKLRAARRREQIRQPQ